MNVIQRTFALVGRNISYSFSRKYFSEKFEKEHITDAVYTNFDLSSIEELPQKIQTMPSLCGMNVTIPYKEQVLDLLSEQSEELLQIKACNTIKVLPNGKLKGYNTDYIGFTNALKPLLKPYHRRALILGTGGAAKAVAFALQQLAIPYLFVSRIGTKEAIFYQELTQELMESHQLIINTTPLGTFPNVKDCPEIPYQYITQEHLLYDLIYNPSKTLFLERGEKKGATILNGYPMLVGQAEASWRIWNEL